jgi:addiction module HigA family antidote
MTQPDATHPGPFIRKHVLPADLTVTAAAKRLGVGRPALSNLCNGKAALSSDMALRIEKTFGYDSKKLLQLQAGYDRAQAQAREPEIAVRAYTPSVLAIKAGQIEAWSEKMEARSEFAALLRRLVYSTGEGLVQLDFPAFENAQRHGWDGFVSADAATPWIPLGDSGWEFGVNHNALQKAEHDYQARSAEIAPDERARITFVFVTPRNWPGKAAWASAKASDNVWKGVRAYDASDLEQWIETSIPAQAWFSERLPLRDPNLLDLQGAWRRWADAANPTLCKSLFPSAAAAANKLNEWLKKPPERPFSVVADSPEEGLAALACAFEAGPLQDGRARERTVVVGTPEALAKLTSATSDFIAILASAKVEAEAAALFRQFHTIVVTHRNGIEGAPDLTVDLVDDRTFHEALTGMGLGRDDVERLDRESGRSLTVLRRRLAQLPALRSPPWAHDAETAKRLVPLMMVGAWDTSSQADQTVVATMADRAFDDTESTVAELVGEADSPLWSINSMRGVVSKTDAFYAVQRHITIAHLRRFFDVARVVLSEEDPALELPDNQKWAAQIYGKTRRHSAALRRSLCETLVLLSVHGDNLFKSRLGFDVVGQVNALIRDLLTPLDGATWQSQQHDLPRYAEAAPEVFLDLLENDLRSQTPKVHALLQPADSGLFSWPGRTGLLWALEALAWNPNWLFRVVILLAKLAEIKISDNWTNKPENSLASIFRCWMPQTATPLEIRIQALELLTRRHPKVGWRICLNQFDSRSTIGHYNAKPQWRPDAAGAGEPVTWNEAHGLARRALEIAIAWPAHDEHTLGDLVERLDRISDDQNAVWAAIRDWLSTGPSNAARAKLREQIRRSAMVRAPREAREGGATVSPEARIVFDALEPTDLIWRHQWLFAQHWVQESAEELRDEAFDFAKQEARVERHRLDALREIWKALGFQGVRELCQLGDTSGLIGGLLAKFLTPEEIENFIVEVVERQSEPSLELCLSGLLWSLTKDVREKIYQAALTPGANGSPFTREGLRRLLLRSPFGPETWVNVAELSADQRTCYWAEVLPQPLFREQSDEANKVVDELLRVKRPRAAFAAVHMVFKNITTDRLLRLLTDVATVNAEPAGHYQMSAHDISAAFDVLSVRSDADPDALARLEFMYIDGLSHTKHGIRNLERQLSESPELFVQALTLTFRRRDGGEDPPELRPNDPEAAERLAQSAYALLSRAGRLPGTNEKGELDGRKLREWIVAARSLAREYGREEIGDSQIGQLLANSAPGKDGVWPLEAVRDVLEDLGTPTMANGMLVGRLNAQGGTWRGEGGDQERTVAKTYRDWSMRVAAQHPFTARLLADLAESYERNAEWHDDRSRVGKRLPH